MGTHSAAAAVIGGGGKGGIGAAAADWHKESDAMAKAKARSGDLARHEITSKMGGASGGASGGGAVRAEAHVSGCGAGGTARGGVEELTESRGSATTGCTNGGAAASAAATEARRWPPSLAPQGEGGTPLELRALHGRRSGW